MKCLVLMGLLGAARGTEGKFKRGDVAFLNNGSRYLKSHLNWTLADEDKNAHVKIVMQLAGHSGNHFNTYYIHKVDGTEFNNITTTKGYSGDYQEVTLPGKRSLSVREEDLVYTRLEDLTPRKRLELQEEVLKELLKTVKKENQTFEDFNRIASTLRSKNKHWYPTLEQEEFEEIMDALLQKQEQDILKELYTAKTVLTLGAFNETAMALSKKNEGSQWYQQMSGEEDFMPFISKLRHDVLELMKKKHKHKRKKSQEKKFFKLTFQKFNAATSKRDYPTLVTDADDFQIKVLLPYAIKKYMKHGSVAGEQDDAMRITKLAEHPIRLNGYMYQTNNKTLKWAQTNKEWKPIVVDPKNKTSPHAICYVTKDQFDAALQEVYSLDGLIAERGADVLKELLGQQRKPTLTEFAKMSRELNEEMKLWYPAFENIFDLQRAVMLPYAIAKLAKSYEQADNKQPKITRKQLNDYNLRFRNMETSDGVSIRWLYESDREDSGPGPRGFSNCKVTDEQFQDAVEDADRCYGADYDFTGLGLRPLRRL